MALTGTLRALPLEAGLVGEGTGTTEEEGMDVGTTVGTLVGTGTTVAERVMVAVAEALADSVADSIEVMGSMEMTSSWAVATITQAARTARVENFMLDLRRGFFCEIGRASCRERVSQLV